MRLTSPLNLPAPGRRQCLYVVLFDFADTCVFAKQSLGPILCDPLRLRWLAPTTTAGSPSPEVTGTFCRVPSPQVTRAPEATRLAYVCPFPVRSQDVLPAEAFLGSWLESTWDLRRDPSHSALDYSRPFTSWKRLPRWTGTTDARLDLRSCVPPAGDDAHPVVQEC